MTHGAIDDANPFSAELAVTPEHRVLLLRGEADMVVVPTLERMVAELHPEAARGIVIDVSGLRFVDCAVIGWMAQLRSRGFAVRVEGATGLVARVLDIVGWSDPAGAVGGGARERG